MQNLFVLLVTSKVTSLLSVHYPSYQSLKKAFKDKLFKKTVTIKNTRQFHHYKPLNEIALQFKVYSTAEETFINRVFKK